MSIIGEFMRDSNLKQQSDFEEIVNFFEGTQLNNYVAFDSLINFIRNTNLKTQASLEKAIHYIENNPVKTVVVVVGTALTGGSCFYFAPVIAGTAGSLGLLGVSSTGTAIVSLKGAALTSASLAKIGLGAVACGGTGMAGGTTIITVTGAAIGAKITSSMTSDDVSTSRGCLWVSEGNLKANPNILASLGIFSKYDIDEEESAITAIAPDHVVNEKIKTNNETEVSKGILYINIEKNKEALAFLDLLLSENIHDSNQ